MATPENKLAFDGGWGYDPAPESTDHIKIKSRYGLFINGEFVKPEMGKYFDTVNPATEERLSRVADAPLAKFECAYDQSVHSAARLRLRDLSRD